MASKEDKTAFLHNLKSLFSRQKVDIEPGVQECSRRNETNNSWFICLDCPDLVFYKKWNARVKNLFIPVSLE